MSQNLKIAPNYAERLNIISSNKERIASNIAGDLVRDYQVPDDVAHRAATDVLSAVPADHFDAFGVGRIGLGDEVRAKALERQSVKEAIAAATRAQNAGKRGFSSDGRAMHELSTTELLEIDSRHFDRLSPDERRAELRRRGDPTA